MSSPSRIATKALFSLAFRPFFLLVGGYAIFMAAGWALYLRGTLPWPNSLPPPLRHGHEMIFGFAGGAIAGFLLTAVATWTGRSPISGAPLVVLCATWVIARAGGVIPGQDGLTVWAVASLVFWAGLLTLMTREVMAAKNSRNYKVIALLLAFFLTEALFFASTPHNTQLVEMSLRTGVFLLVGMISLVGGRIVPAFTQNWLRLNRPHIAACLPSFDWVDLCTVALTVAFAMGFVLWPQSGPTGVLGLSAAIAQAARLLRWRGWLAWREPLLWVLHVGYAWIAVGFALLGVASLGYSAWYDPGIHALTYGAIGTLILGVAARVALGHTGRPLRASPSMVIAFGLMTVGTVVRIFASVSHGLLMLSVLLWVGAYLLFLVQYTPILLTPRQEG